MDQGADDTESKCRVDVPEEDIGGQITLFTKPDCSYCVKLQQTVEKCAEEVLAKHPEGKFYPVSLRNCPISLNVAQIGRLDWKVIDCQGVNASLCVRLTGSFSVPHVFFNDQYIGDCTSTCDQCNTPCEDENPIMKKLTAIALGPRMKTPFPPTPQAAIVKITDDLACSGQPSDEQLAKLKTLYGFASVINLTSPIEASFSTDESELLEQAGIKYTSLPLLSMTVQMVMRVLQQVEAAPKPALVHCDSGQRAAMVALLVATKGESNVTDQDFIEWGKELDLDLNPFATVALNVVKALKSEVKPSTTNDNASVEPKKRVKQADDDDDECGHCH
jgi:protein tyrosine phosphatase (PTP) superfamily phosphohydrolase (DUF442 family)/glutaredoxin